MDFFDGALRDEAQLRELYDLPNARAVRKDIGRLDTMCRRLIAASPMVLVSSFGQEGSCDVSPRGGPPGFVVVLDERHVAIPDATGNRRLDSLTNILATARAGLLFLIPGRDTTLRVNGSACVTARADILERLSPVGRSPASAVVVRVEEAYAHCPKAFIRSRLWDPASWPSGSLLPSPAEVTLAHLAEPELTLAAVERIQHESVRYRLH